MNPKDINILVGCEESQAVTIELRKLGFNAYSCDIQECSGGHPEWHLRMDVFEAIKGGTFGGLGHNNVVHINKWHAAIFFPDCTYLTVTGNKWMKDQPPRKSGALVGAARRQAREQAVQFFLNLYNSDIDYVALENPVGVMSTYFRPPDQIINPYQFGHPEPKKTCLWVKGLPLLKPTNIVEQEAYHVTKSGKNLPKWYAYADKSKGQKERAKIRSKTFPGIAQAMAEQYGNFLFKKYCDHHWVTNKPGEPTTCAKCSSTWG